jgi:hypothetical protein
VAYLVIRATGATRTRQDAVDRARQLFERFHAFAPPLLLRQRCTREIPDVLVKLGRLRGLIYTSDKGRCGQPRTYVHFMETMPLLACDPRGRQLHILGGRYRVTARGIEG